MGTMSMSNPGTSPLCSHLVLVIVIHSAGVMVLFVRRSLRHASCLHTEAKVTW